MASGFSGQKRGGYDCNFVEDPPDALKCLFCLYVVRDPQQHGECGKLFCQSCITEYRKLNSSCPHCRRNLIIFKDGRSTQEVKSLKVNCDNIYNGCKWVGELRYLEEHLLTCDYVLMPCTNKCKDGADIVKVLRKDLNEHLRNKCIRRSFPCQHCNERGEYKERTTTHLQTCPKVKIQCTNDQCTLKFPRCEVTIHRSTCLYERVPCKYAEVGCKEKPLRIDLKTHEENDELHLKMITETVLKLNKKVTTLESTLKRTIISHCTFRMANYQNYYKDGYMFFSRPFYTSYTGYKMCVRVHAHGISSGKGTHVSVFAHLMKGDNDDSITWPFTGTVKYELLNQLEDNNHYTNNVEPFSADRASSQRVVEGNRAEKGWGYAQFIPHTELGYNVDKNCQYLKDDCLVFRIFVDVPKSWLECT